MELCRVKKKQLQRVTYCIHSLGRMIREMENGLVIFQQLMAGRHKCGNRALLGVLLHYGCAIYYH